MRIKTKSIVIFALSSSLGLTTLASPAQKPFRPEITIANEHAVLESGFGGSAKITFDGHKVIEVELKTIKELDKVAELVEVYNLDLWTALRLGPVQVRIPPALLPHVLPNLPSHYRILHEDVQSLIDSIPLSALSNSDDPDDPDNPDDEDPKAFFRRYHNYDEVTNFTFGIAEKYPSISEVFSVGKTHEGRDIWGVRLFGRRFAPLDGVDDGESDSQDAGNNKDDDEEMMMQRLKDGFDSMLEDGREVLEDLEDQGGDLFDWMVEKLGLEILKPRDKDTRVEMARPRGIVLHGGQHGREWISVAVLTYLMDALASSYGKDSKLTQLVDTFEWSLIPVMNVDGFVFSNERNRMWRKNRQPTSFPWCVGTDVNRNWAYKWNHGGSSSNPCSEAYMGPSAFSAPESKLMADYVAGRGNVVAYIDFHAFSQLWMTPFGGDCDEKPKDNENILELALGAAKALARVHGKKFAVGPVCDIIYQASGGSIDWTYAVAKVKYSYGVELRDTGTYGFLLPPEEILPSGEELLSAVVYMAQFIREREKRLN